MKGVTVKRLQTFRGDKVNLDDEKSRRSVTLSSTVRKIRLYTINV